MECLPCESCQDVEWSEKRNKAAAAVAGGLFAAGAWFAIDASVTDYNNTNDLYHLCGVFSFLSLVMVNTVSNSQLQGDSMYEGGLLGGATAKIWFFFGLLMGFGALMASCVILFSDYPVTSSSVTAFTSVIPGIKFVLENLLMMASSLIYRFGRVEDLWG